MLRIYPQALEDRLYLDAGTYRIAAEHPVGDPFGGPAYGQKAMPVAAIAVAATSFIAGATIATAAGATVAAMVAGGAMMVGAAMTVVGVVTGRQNLVRWGGILTAVGGIGAGILGATGMLTEGAQLAAGEGAIQLAGPGTEGIVNPADAANLADAAGGATQLSGPGADVAAKAAEGLSTGIDGVVTEAVPAVEPVAPPPSEAVQPVAAAPGEPSAAPFATQDPSAFATPDQTAFAPRGLISEPPGTPMAAGGTDPGLLSRASAWIKENKELTQMATQGISGLLGAVPKPESDYTRALTEESRRRAERLDPNSSWWRKYPKPAGG